MRGGYFRPRGGLVHTHLFRFRFLFSQNPVWGKHVLRGRKLLDVIYIIWRVAEALVYGCFHLFWLFLCFPPLLDLRGIINYTQENKNRIDWDKYVRKQKLTNEYKYFPRLITRFIRASWGCSMCWILNDCLVSKIVNARQLSHDGQK